MSSPRSPGLLRQLGVLFDREDAWQAAGLLVLMSIGAGLEMMAVSLMFPLIEALSNPGAAPTMPVAAFIRQLAGDADPAGFVFLLLSCLVAFYVAKNLFFAFLFYLQNRFSFHQQGKLSCRLFARYLDQPYTFHLQRNTADLLRNVTHETEQIVWSLVIPGLTLMTEALVALGLATVLFYSSFQAAMVISSLFGITGAIYYRFFRNSLERWGHGRIHHDTLRVRAIHEGLGGIKELKVLGRSGYFLGNYAHHNAQRALFTSRHNLVINSNLLLLEVLGISSLLVLVGLHLYQGQPFSTILPLMGMFAGAAFRLIPATNRIINNFQQVRYARPALATLYQELSPPAGNPSLPENAEAIPIRRQIELRAVSFRYAPDAPDVLHGIDLTIPRGQTVGIVGRSGTGKTTLLDLLLGILQPRSGHILVDGQDVSGRLAAWQRQIGYIPQNIYLVDGTIRQNIAFAIPEAEIDDDRVMSALQDAQLAEYVAALPQGIHTPVGELGKRMSGGQRQRIGIARALYNDPEFLVLDEATASLDTATEAEVIGTIRGMHSRKTILIITHRTATLGCCDRVYRLEKGSVSEVRDIAASAHP
jgi:ABC-type multidrug transport system fused ATPase/permease subunit